MRFEDYDWDESEIGRRKPLKSRDPKGKTSKAARSRDRENSVGKRKAMARARIQTVIDNFPKFDNEKDKKEFENRYNSWVKECLEKKEVILRGEDLKIVTTKSGKKAGGQNVNKVSSAVVLIHVLTNMKVRNEQTRDQLTNKANAIKILYDRLAQHINDWREII